MLWIACNETTVDEISAPAVHPTTSSCMYIYISRIVALPGCCGPLPFPLYRCRVLKNSASFSQADARAATSAGLTPLHCLALYNANGNANRNGRRGGGADDENLPAGEHDDEDDGDGSTSQSQQSSTALLAISPPTTAAGAAAAKPAESLASPPGVEAAATATALTPPKEAPPPPHHHHHQELRSTCSTDPSTSTSKQQQLLLRRYQQKQRELSMDRSVRTIADLLLDAGAWPDAIDADGNTPLLTAAATGGAALCELLLERGANPRAT